MRGRRLLKAIFIIVVASALLLAFTYLFFPLTRVNMTIAQVLSNHGLALAPTAHKTILPGLGWKKPKLSSEQGILVRMERFDIKLCLLPLMLGQVKLKADSIIGAGRLEMEFGLTGKDAFTLSIDNTNLADIPFFDSVLKAKASGLLWSQGALVRSKKGIQGELKLEIKGMELAGAKLGAFALPDVSNLNSQGVVRFTDGKARLESFTLQGDGIYMRLSGNLPSDANAVNAPLDLVLEIMPKPEFMERQKLIFMLLTKFMISPGNFRVPIRGTLLKPEIV